MKKKDSGILAERRQFLRGACLLGGMALLCPSSWVFAGQSPKAQEGCTVKLDGGKCSGCGMCVDVCPTEVLIMSGGKAKIAEPHECLGCESCIEVCEKGALEVACAE